MCHAIIHLKVRMKIYKKTKKSRISCIKKIKKFNILDKKQKIHQNSKKDLLNKKKEYSNFPKKIKG